VNPNPFNISTFISFDLKSASEVELTIYNITGRKVMTLDARYLILGTNEAMWNAEGLGNGIYFIRLSGEGGQSLERKTVLIK
jgi:hypothetical protein